MGKRKQVQQESAGVEELKDDGWTTFSFDEIGLDSADALVPIEVIQPMAAMAAMDGPPAAKKLKPAKKQKKPVEQQPAKPHKLTKEEYGKEKLRKYKEKKKRQKEEKLKAASGSVDGAGSNATKTASAPEQSDKPSKKLKQKKKKQEQPVVPEPAPEEEEEEEQALGPDTDEEDEEHWELAGEYGAWLATGVHTSLLKAIEQMGFVAPTPIQAAAIPMAIQSQKDVVGAAATGSGKTLAFGLPVLHRVLQGRTSEPGLRALVISPTRELAMQIRDHLKAAAQFSAVQVAVLVGGMSQQKQERILTHRPEIVVGTPGRMWELMSNQDPHLSELSKLCCLVLDEADRLVETGHFVGVSRIIEHIANRELRAKAAAAASLMEDDQDDHEPEPVRFPRVQKFLFSATMTLEKKGKGFKARKVSGVQDSTLQQLIKRLDLHADPLFIDYSGSSKGQAAAAQLHEYMIQTPNEDKELLLYNFLFSHPGRTLVFVNAVSMVRRVASILQNLKLPVYPLHADMQQRQRLKNMDRFSGEKHVVLVATDVAARGIDVQDVDYVVQFHVPFNAETYVHRTGRTARAAAEGTSVVFVSGNEQTQYRTIMHTLGKGAAGLPTLTLDARPLAALKTRLRLAKQLDKQEHGIKKKKVEKTWMQKSAEALDIILDDDGNESDQEFKSKQEKVKEGNLRRELDALLHQDV